jgi:pectate lyase
MKATLLFCCSLLGAVLAVTCPADTVVNGYASVEGGTTGGGTATAVTVTTLADLTSNAGASSSRVIIVKGKSTPTAPLLLQVTRPLKATMQVPPLSEVLL